MWCSSRVLRWTLSMCSILTHIYSTEDTDSNEHNISSVILNLLNWVRKCRILEQYWWFALTWDLITQFPNGTCKSLCISHSEFLFLVTAGSPIFSFLEGLFSGDNRDESRASSDLFHLQIRWLKYNGSEKTYRRWALVDPFLYFNCSRIRS